MNETLSINIKIDNRIYPLVIRRKEEEKYRTAARRLNEVISSFRSDYPEKSSLDIVSMAAFQFAFDGIRLQETAENLPLVGELKDIRDDIADFLESKKASRP